LVIISILHLLSINQSIVSLSLLIHPENVLIICGSINVHSYCLMMNCASDDDSSWNGASSDDEDDTMAEQQQNHIQRVNSSF